MIFEEAQLFGKRDKGLPALAGEVKQLAIDYAKQETIEPLKGLVRFLAVGIASSLLLGIGLSFWALAALRAMQTETGSTFTAHLSWLPYLITFVGCLVIIFMAVFAIGKENRRMKRRQANRAAQDGKAS